MSVYAAADLSLVHIVPLTLAPEKIAIMAAETRVVATHPADNAVPIIDYLIGQEIEIIPVGERPLVVAVAPDDSVAVVQGGVFATKLYGSILVGYQPVA